MLENRVIDDLSFMSSGENNTLEITGDDDNVSTVDTTGWNKDTAHTDSDSGDGMNEYVYTNDSDSSITLKVDENIDNTGL